MKRLLLIGLLLLGGGVMALEKPKYEVVFEHSNGIELRRYAAHILIETEVDAAFEDAGNAAFRRLAGYIGGNNRASTKVSMTVPVNQRSAAEPEKMAMTAPVSQRAEGQSYVISFVLPSKYSLDSAPEPTDSRVRLSRVPPSLVAAIRYRGRWTEETYQERLAELKQTIDELNWQISGEPNFARYNPPIVPGLLRRNEILIPVAVPETGVLRNPDNVVPINRLTAAR